MRNIRTTSISRWLLVLIVICLAMLFLSVIPLQMVKGILYYPEQNQTYSTPYLTASNRVIDQVDPFSSKYIAVSAYMETVYPLGTKVRISSTRVPELNSVYTVADRLDQDYVGTEMIGILVSKKMYERVDFTSGMFTIEPYN